MKLPLLMSLCLFPLVASVTSCKEKGPAEEAGEGIDKAVEALGNTRDQAVVAALNELAAVFGDKSVLGRMRAVLADASASMAERKSAFALLKRTGDPEALPVFAALLDQPAFRSDDKETI